MVGDVEIAAKVFEHPLVRTDGTKKTQRQMEEGDEKVTWLAKLLKIEHKPSYVSAENFARALLAVAKEHPKRTEPATAGAPDSDFLWKQLEALGIRGLRASVDSDIATVEKWFNDSMERVSGWYKRKSQYVTIGIAIVVAVACNANTLRIAERLDHEPSTRAAVVVAAEGALKEPCCGQATSEEETGQEAVGGGESEPKATGATKAEPSSEKDEIEASINHFSEATKGVEDLNLPIFWSHDNSWSSMSVAETLFGWLLTAIAISLGAPFWFDALGRLANLRMAGKNPEEKGKAGK
jgi:hypothetical protein